MAQARRLVALFALIAVLAGCGSSSPKPPRGGPVLRLAIAADPATLDPARVADLPALNVAHELYAGLTRFSGRGVVPDLAESWEPSQGGLVWTFHLRKGLRWSYGAPITAQDFRRSWLRALDPKTGSAYARAEMLNISGARRYYATGSGDVGVEALDARTLRVTLAHPVPWLDQQVAYPVFFAVPHGGRAWSGPFRLASRSKGRLVLERNVTYWNVANVKPRRVVLTTSTKDVDGVLPRGLVAPGFPWIATAPQPPVGKRGLSTLSLGLLWFVTRGTPLADANARRFVAWSVSYLDRSLPRFVPQVMPGAPTIDASFWRPSTYASQRLRLTLAYTEQGAVSASVARDVRERLGEDGVAVTLKPVATLRELLQLAGPPARPGIDMVLLGWSAEFFDAYNILDLFPCASALNVARWCDPSYDRLMRRAVRTLDDRDRWEIERQLVVELNKALPAVPLYESYAYVSLKPGVRGFRWSPIGLYELAGMTRS